MPTKEENQQEIDELADELILAKLRQLKADDQVPSSALISAITKRYGAKAIIDAPKDAQLQLVPKASDWSDEKA